MTTIAQAIASLRPEAEWVLRGDRYQDLEWRDSYDPPTEQEVMDEIDRLDAVAEAERQRVLDFLGNTSRSEFVDKLMTASPAQIETFVRTRLNADAVVDLASAKAFCKRMETAFVTLMDVLALWVKR